MKTRCPKCKVEFDRGYRFSYSSLDLCGDCNDKKVRKEGILGIMAIIVGVTLIVGIRYFYAKVVYNDTRCIFAECRIMK